MTAETPKCEKCKRTKVPVKQYEFYYGEAFTFSGGPSPVPFIDGDKHFPPRVYERIIGTKSAYICDRCILQKRFSYLIVSLAVFVIYSTIGVILFHYWPSLLPALKAFQPSACCACVLLWMGTLIVCMLGLIPFVFFFQIFASKDELGDLLSIEANRKIMSPHADSTVDPMGLNPTIRTVFWTRKNKPKK